MRTAWRDRLVGGDFARNVATLLTGTMVSQAVPILASPVLARLYSPATYGSFAVFSSVTSIAGIVVTGRYELAVLLPADDRTASLVAGVSIALSCLVAALGLVSLVLAGPTAARAVGDPSLTPWLYAVPVSLLLTGCYQTLYYWTNRQGNYRALSRSRMFQSMVGTALNLGLGLIGCGVGGLIVGGIAGQSAGLVLLVTSVWRGGALRASGFTVQSLFGVARAYRSFPLYSMPADMVNATTHQLPTLLLNTFCGPSVVGLYSLTQRVLATPVTMLASAILDVFKQRASREHATTGTCRATFVRTLRTLVVIATPAFGLLIICAPWAFAILFGEQWREAGRYTQIVAVMYCVRFISSPLTFTYFIVGRQREDLLLQVCLAASTFVTMTIAHHLSSSPSAVLWAFTGNVSVIYLVYVTRSYGFSRGSVHPLRVAPADCAVTQGES